MKTNDGTAQDIRDWAKKSPAKKKSTTKASKKSDAPSTKASAKKSHSCWSNHPMYVIDDCEIMGGSCTSQYPDVDVYIGLDYGMKTGPRAMPWNDGVDIRFEIRDMNVPTDLEEFKNLLDYTEESLRAGKSVFVGCIGGHGRTGLFLAALTKQMTGDKDAIKTVRAKYCTKAVESAKQVEWLHKYFGITKVEGSKSFSSYSSKGQGSFSDKWGGTSSSVPEWTQGQVTKAKPTEYCFVKGSSLIENNS